VVQGDRGRDRYFGVLHLVPEYEYVYKGKKERERKDKEGGKLFEREQTVI